MRSELRRISEGKCVECEDKAEPGRRRCKRHLAIRNEQQTARRNADREKTRAYDRAAYARDPERARAKAKKWREANPEDARAVYKRWYEQNTKQARDNYLRWVRENPEMAKAGKRRCDLQRKGWSEEAYDRAMVEQDGKCWVCGKSATLKADHCHGCGVGRALLCNSCNIAEGVWSKRILPYEDKFRELHKKCECRREEQKKCREE